MRLLKREGIGIIKGKSGDKDVGGLKNGPGWYRKEA